MLFYSYSCFLLIELYQSGLRASVQARHALPVVPGPAKILPHVRSRQESRRLRSPYSLDNKSVLTLLVGGWAGRKVPYVRPYAHPAFRRDGAGNRSPLSLPRPLSAFQACGRAAGQCTDCRRHGRVRSGLWHRWAPSREPSWKTAAMSPGRYPLPRPSRQAGTRQTRQPAPDVGRLGRPRRPSRRPRRGVPARRR